jgi:hypothetical protein
MNREDGMARGWNRRQVIGLAGASGLAALAGGWAASRPGFRLAANATDAKNAAALCGRMLLPGDEGFEQELSGWNLNMQHHPAAIVVATCPADVEFAVDYANKNRLPIAVQATGHGVSVPADGAMFINTRLLNSVSINPDTEIVTTGAGVKWKAVLEQAGPLGLGPLVGSSSDVAVAGYTSGGGLPVLGRRYGFQVDSVTGLDIVTVKDAKLKSASPGSNANLFYAARGGRGNFGVITSIKTRLVRQPTLYGGGLFYSADAALNVLRTYLRWTKDQPAAMTSSIALLHALPLPGGASLLVHLRIGYTGSPAEGARLIAPLRALGPIDDTVQEIPYTQIGTIHADPDAPTPAYVRAALMRPVDDAIADRIMAAVGTGAGLPPGAVEIRHMGGALSRSPSSPNAIGAGVRGSAYHFFSGILVGPDRFGEVQSLHGKLFDAIAPWNNGRIFPNFLGYNDTSPDKVRAAYDSTDYLKLRGIKRAVDPDNRLRVNFNIPPL